MDISEIESIAKTFINFSVLYISILYLIERITNSLHRTLNVHILGELRITNNGLWITDFGTLDLGSPTGSCHFWTFCS